MNGTGRAWTELIKEQTELIRGQAETEQRGGRGQDLVGEAEVEWSW